MYSGSCDRPRMRRFFGSSGVPNFSFVFLDIPSERWVSPLPSPIRLLFFFSLFFFNGRTVDSSLSRLTFEPTVNRSLCSQRFEPFPLSPPFSPPLSLSLPFSFPFYSSSYECALFSLSFISGFSHLSFSLPATFLDFEIQLRFAATRLFDRE